MRANFQIAATNPNNYSGVGGCACSETYNEDQHGPFVVFNGPMLDNFGQLQQNVVCAGCVHAAVTKIDAFVKDNEVIELVGDDISDLAEDEPTEPVKVRGL